MRAILLLIMGVAIALVILFRSRRRVSRSRPQVMSDLIAQATDDRLAITFRLMPGVKMDRVPLRTLELTFKNVSPFPLRIFLPRIEAFRATISTFTLSADETIGGSWFIVPDFRPHGYILTHADFFLLAPGDEMQFSQSFTLDLLQPGNDNKLIRRPGFETGRTVRIQWRYQNTTDRFPGGIKTMDGLTRSLFGGKRVPHLWTGELIARGTWTIMD